MRLNLNNDGTGRSGRREAAAALRGYLRGRGLRMTGEREALLLAALARGSHFTLDQLAAEMVRRDGRASRATVFRSLPILVEAGILQPATVGGEARRFELALGRRHHDHLRCRRCGKIVEFRSEAIERRQVSIARRHGFSLAGHLHELVGDCLACRRRRSAGRARRPTRPEARAAGTGR